MKLGRRPNDQKGRAAMRHFANQPEIFASLRIAFKLYGQQPALFTRLLVVVVTLGVPGPVSLSV